ncbi:MAG: hypothetical protein H7282_01535 [Cytophagaceae bacterium]|nr:hypothetical protein [Cytophagaceae bacterium]
MKRLLLSISIFCLLAGGEETQAQSKNNKEIVLVNADASVDKFHTMSDLKSKNKGELIAIYKDRFKVITYLLPYTALSNKPGVTLSVLGVPENSENKSLIEKEAKATEQLNQAFSVTLDNFIAYADSDNIIWSILLYEEMIRKLLLGKDN